MRSENKIQNNPSNLIKMDFFLKEINLFKDDKYIKSS
jgi:hypothetical protein